MSVGWQKAQSLKGRTLYTLKQRKPFNVIDVLIDRIILVPQEGKQTPRWIAREQIEATCRQGTDRAITPGLVRTLYPEDRNTSYIAAIASDINNQQN
jgi:hypothetical protein